MKEIKPATILINHSSRKQRVGRNYIQLAFFIFEKTPTGLNDVNSFGDVCPN